MFKRIKRLFSLPVAVAPASILVGFSDKDPPISTLPVLNDEGDWSAQIQKPQTLLLYEIHQHEVEQCLLTYRMQVKTEDFKGRVYLEMWCDLPGRGNFFSKGLHNAIKNNHDWVTIEIPFYLQKKQKPESIRLNLVVKGIGKVWFSKPTLLMTPFSR